MAEEVVAVAVEVVVAVECRRHQCLRRFLEGWRAERSQRCNRSG